MNNKKDKSKWIFFGLGVIVGVIIMLMLQPQPTSKSYEDTEWFKAVKSNEAKIVYMGRPTCSWCSKFKPGLDNLSEQYDIDYVYVNTDEVSETEFNAALEALDVDASTFGTPHTVIVKNGAKIAEQPGYINEAKLFEFLKTNGFIEKDAVYTPNEKTPTE